MDAKSRGQLQALLSSTALLGLNKEPINHENITAEINKFLLNFQKHLHDVSRISECLKKSNEKVEKLEEIISETKTDLDEERQQKHSLQQELFKLHKMEGELNETNTALRLAESSLETYKADVARLSDVAKNKDGEIQSLNNKILEKDCNTNKLHKTIALHLESISSLEEELKQERDNSHSLNKQIEELKSTHDEQLEKLKIEMGEKVMRVQARITAQQSVLPGSVSSDSSSLDYKEIFKKKMAHVESKHAKEVEELRAKLILSPPFLHQTTELSICYWVEIMGLCGKDKYECSKSNSPDSSSNTNSSSSEEEARGNWGNKFEFLLSTVGYAVGLGNLWRFPYLCYKNGGGAFLIPYTIFLFLCGIPLVFMEMSAGQFAQAGPVGVWSLCPLAKGLGLGMVMVSVYCCVYYNVIIMWTLYYFFHSFSKVLPWSGCGNWWNTDQCTPLGQKVNTTQATAPCLSTDMGDNTTSLNGTVVSYVDGLANATLALCNETLTSSEDIKRPPYPAEEFWECQSIFNIAFIHYLHVYSITRFLSRSGSITDVIELRWDLTLILLFAWILVYLCLIKGIKSSGKVVYVTATAPYILLTVLLIQGATMEGSIKGVEFYMKPNFTKLAEPTVWVEACGQIFFSLGAAWGGLITMASYNKFNTNIYRFSVVVPLINCATSIYAGFVIFCVLGYMANEAGVEVKDIIDKGPGLVFVAYPYAISQLPVPQLWAVLFFIMILSVGLDSQFAMFETFTTSVMDEFGEYFNSRLKKSLFTGVLCLIAFCLGLICCTHAGVYFFQLMDGYIGIFSLLLISAVECIVIGWVYGGERLYRDIEAMIGYKPFIVWRIMWQFVTPLIVFGMFFYTLVKYEAPKYGDMEYPSAAIGIAWLYGISSSLPILVYPLYLLFIKTRGEPLGLWQKILKYSKPLPEWGSKKHHQPQVLSSSLDSKSDPEITPMTSTPDYEVKTSAEMEEISTEHEKLTTDNDCQA
ncbi:hypothetical protein EB796_016468 [Bugula neritina]|uniref:Transporter n=1 Tax=Bugula neritina TaxID=10212 RepID=A0A7J7JFY0_BUGNE|nr:hypothetical protein EB796_016468 [Bugula neritina]